MKKITKTRIALGIIGFLMSTNALASINCSYYSNVLENKSFFSWEHETAFKANLEKLKEALRKKGYFETNKHNAQLVLKNFTYGCTMVDSSNDSYCKEAKASIGLTYNTRNYRRKIFKHETSVRHKKNLTNSISSAINLSLIKVPDCHSRKGLQRPLID